MVCFIVDRIKKVDIKEVEGKLKLKEDVSMKKELIRKKYDEEFKREAVRLVVEEKRVAAEVERNLGISGGSICHWKRLLKEDEKNPFPGKGFRRPQEEKLYQLKRENNRLRQERDILKKAMAIFSTNR